MPYEIGLSDAGLVVPRLADYLDEIRTRYVDQSGVDVDWDSDLVLAQLTAIMAQLLDQQAEALQAVYDAFDLGNATGVQLSNLARIVGVTRKRAVAARAVVTLTGTAGTAISRGKLVEGGGSDGRSRWSVVEDTTIGVGGTVDTEVEAQIAGYTVALPGEIDQIVTPVPGWTAVTNALSASPGSDAETDAELRIRREQSVQAGAGIGIAAIRSKVLNLEFVEACAVIDNPDNEAKVVEGISLPAHSFIVIVLPDSLTTDQDEELLQLIYDNTPVSTLAHGTDVTGLIVGADGVEHEVAFDYGQPVAANIVVTFVMFTSYSAADAGVALKLLVEEKIGQLSLGEPLLQITICALASLVPGVKGITATINGGSNLEVTAAQRVVPGTWTAS